MDMRDISIVTMSWARDAQEDSLLRESLSELAALNLPVFVTDGGSGETFVDYLRGLPRFNVFEPEARGLWPQVRRSLRAAYEADAATDFILYTEPDKKDFFREGLRDLISEANAGERAGVVLAARTSESFATFPAFQRHTETTINVCCAEVVGERFDFTYGPFLLDRRLVPHLLGAPDDIGWGWRPYAFGIASRLGLRVESLEKAAACPAEQREESRAERMYRIRQLSQSLEGLLLSTTAELANAR
jgi:hypothetical protein